MSKRKIFKSGQGYTKKDWEAVSDNPPLTKKQLAEMRPFSEVFPELSASIRRRGPNKSPTKQLVSLRLSQDVLKHFRATGPGWQTKIDETLRKAAKLKAS